MINNGLLYIFSILLIISLSDSTTPENNWNPIKSLGYYL